MSKLSGDVRSTRRSTLVFVCESAALSLSVFVILFCGLSLTVSFKPAGDEWLGSGDESGFRSMADHVIDEYFCHFDPADVKEGDIIFVNTFLLSVAPARSWLLRGGVLGSDFEERLTGQRHVRAQRQLRRER